MRVQVQDACTLLPPPPRDPIGCDADPPCPSVPFAACAPLVLLALVPWHSQNGSLYDYMSGASWPGSLCKEQQLSMATDVAQGMKYLHAKSLIHRDLKSPNLLISHVSTSYASFLSCRIILARRGGPAPQPSPAQPPTVPVVKALVCSSLGVGQGLSVPLLLLLGRGRIGASRSRTSACRGPRTSTKWATPCS